MPANGVQPLMAGQSFSMAEMSDGSSRTNSHIQVLPGLTEDAALKLASRKLQGGEHYPKVILGVIFMVIGSVCWTGASQFGKSTYDRPRFAAPLAVTYLCISGNVIWYPLCLLGYVIHAKGKIRLKETLRDDILVYGDASVSLRFPKIVGKCAFFSFLWTFSHYVYIRALNMKPTLDVVVLFATYSSFVYLMSWIILQKQFMAIRIVALILGITGISIITYMDGGFASDNMWGSVLAVTSTAAAALHKVLFRKMAGEASVGQVCLFLSCLGLFSSVSLLPLLALLTLTGAEPLDWYHIPWTFVGGSFGFVTALVLLMYFGVYVTYNLFIQFAFIVSIPMCAAVDLIWREESFSGMQISATCLIIVSAFLNLLPENWYDSFLRTLHWQRREESREDAVMTPRQRLRSTTC